MNCFRITLENATIINIINNNNTNIAYIEKQHGQLMAIIAYRNLKLEPVIKKSVVTSHTFFTFITLSNINSFTKTNSIAIQHL